MCLTYFESATSGSGGIFLSSETRMTVSVDGSIRIRAGELYRLPGADAHCWPSPRSGGSFTTWPSERVNVSYTCKRPCTQYSPGGTLERLTTGYPGAVLSNTVS